MGKAGATSIVLLAILVIANIASPSQAVSAFHSSSQVNLEYYFYVNNVPAGIVDATFRTGAVKGMMVQDIKYLGEGSFAGISELFKQILVWSSMDCLSANSMSSVSHVVTYYVNWSKNFLVKAEREMSIKSTLDNGYVVELKSSFSRNSCIPLTGRLRVYRGNAFLYEVQYILLESSQVLPDSIKLLDPLKRTITLALVSIITIASLYVVSKSGKYRIM